MPEPLHMTYDTWHVTRTHNNVGVGFEGFTEENKYTLKWNNIIVKDKAP